MQHQLHISIASLALTAKQIHTNTYIKDITLQFIVLQHLQAIQYPIKLPQTHAVDSNIIALIELLPSFPSEDAPFNLSFTMLI